MAATQVTPFYAGLSDPRAIAARARQEAAEEDRRAEQAGMQALTLRVAWLDAREALLGIPADLSRSPSVPLGEALIKHNRLRGLAVLLLALGVLGVAIL
jgi:hypothetical protein